MKFLQFLKALKSIAESLLHFLRFFPSWLIIFLLIVIFLYVYIKTGDAYFQRVIDNFTGALLAILTGKAIGNIYTANKQTESENLKTSEAEK